MDDPYLKKDKLRIRGSAGFGDVFYLYPIVNYYAEAFDKLGKPRKDIEICSGHPSIFDGLGVTSSKFRRSQVDMVATYATSWESKFNHYQDTLNFAGLPYIPFHVNWKIRDKEMCDMVKKQFRRSGKKKMAFLASSTWPHGIVDEKRIKKCPDWRVIDSLLSDSFFIVKVGIGEQIFNYTKCDIDLHNKVTATQTADLASIADFIICHNGSFDVIGQCFNKPTFTVLSKDARNCDDVIIRQSVNQEKIKYRNPCPSWHIFDDHENIKNKFNEFFERII